MLLFTRFCLHKNNKNVIFVLYSKSSLKYESIRNG